MERRKLGQTGVTLPALGFGCGMVGGLMTRGGVADQERAIARALELGVNYFDTAPLYGDGASETNLGRVFKITASEGCVCQHKILDQSGRKESDR